MLQPVRSNHLLIFEFPSDRKVSQAEEFDVSVIRLVVLDHQRLSVTLLDSLSECNRFKAISAGPVIRSRVFLNSETSMAEKV